jgi:hypothetical protein
MNGVTRQQIDFCPAATLLDDSGLRNSGSSGRTNIINEAYARMYLKD